MTPHELAIVVWAVFTCFSVGLMVVIYRQRRRHWLELEREMKRMEHERTESWRHHDDANR